MGNHIPKPKIGMFTVEFSAGRGYHVYDPQGRMVAGPYTNRQNALTACAARQSAADKMSRRGPRPCLCCGATFPSEGPHNRMCGDCRLRADDTIAHSFINPRRRTG